jgi:putative ABC transport system permease protein
VRARSTSIGSPSGGVPPADPLTIGGAALALVATAMLAAWLPARRASRVDAAVALRQAGGA